MSPSQPRIRRLWSAGLLLALSGCAAFPPTDEAVPQSGQAQGLSLARFHAPRPGIRTAGRIGAGDLPALKAAGIVHVIDLSLGSETSGFDEAAAVRAQGMVYDNLPIAGADGLTRESVAAFDQLLRNAKGPVLVHCASGNRVGALAAMRAALLEGKPVEEAIAEGRRWGLGSLEAEVRRRLQPGP